MQITKIIKTIENKDISHDSWEILMDVVLYDDDKSRLQSIACANTLEEAFEIANNKGYNILNFQKDLNYYKKSEYRIVEEKNNYVYDSYNRIGWNIELIHYYYFD